MNEEIRNLEPQVIWNKFADLNAVPRPSKKENRMIAFMKEFGEKLNLDTQVDKIGNVTVANVLKGENEHLIAEAKRVISLMPKWTPAKSNGKPIDMFMAIPFRFELPSK